MKHESAVQAVKELMRKDSVFRSVIQGWGVATLLIGLFMFYMGANTYIQSYKQTDWVFGSAYITDISELNRSVEQKQSWQGWHQLFDDLRI